MRFSGLACSGAWAFVWSWYGQTSNFKKDQYQSDTSHKVRATYSLVKLACGLSRLRVIFSLACHVGLPSSCAFWQPVRSIYYLGCCDGSKYAATRLRRSLEVLVGTASCFELPASFPFPFVLGVDFAFITLGVLESVKVCEGAAIVSSPIARHLYKLLCIGHTGYLVEECGPMRRFDFSYYRRQSRSSMHVIRRPATYPYIHI